MPYANNNGVKIYYEVEGEGPPLVMLHPGGEDLTSWRRDGYAEALKKENRLILIDLRGHGKSDKPIDAELYDLEHRIGDVTVVMDDLNVSSAHFIGFSYGGRIGLECAKVFPYRVLSLITGGIGPQGKSFDGTNTMLKLFEAGPEAVISLLERSRPLPPQEKAKYLGPEFNAFVALQRSPWPNLEADLPAMTMPFLILLGEFDHLWPPQVTNKAFSALPDVTFVVLPGLNHVQSGQRSDLVLPHIKEFLTKVSKK
jgi:pimeloyl-ACP methyl ester carboxylesterase